MEARLGADFSDVVVHTDADAAASAASVSAKAYTVGNEVVFGAGSFAPETAEGQRRLAHELVHVEQQRRGLVSGTDGGRGLAVSSPSDALEQEAEATATRGLSGSWGGPTSASVGRQAGLSARPTARRPLPARPVTSRLVVQRDDGSPGISPPVDTRGFWDAVRAGDWEGAASTLVRFDAGTIENQVNALEVENLEPLKAVSDRVNGVDAPKVRVPILDRQFTLAASSDRWNDAASLLNAFSNEDIKKRIDVMDPRWLAPLKAAADATLGDAASRIRAPILRRWFWDALGSDYEGAARTLNGFSGTNIVGLVAKVPEDKLEPLKQASDRVNQGDPSGRIRTPILTRQYDAAVRDGMWVDAARHLNGFSPADIRTRLEKLTPPQLDELRVGAHIAGLEALAIVIAAFYSQLESDTGTSPIYDMSADPKTPGQINLDVHHERDSPRYVDNAATAVLVGIYLPGYFVYIAGLDKPIVVPWEYVEFSTRAMVSESETVYPSREEALKHAGDTAGAKGGPAEFGFYRAAAGLTAPTVFSSATTPRIEQMALGAIRELGQSVSNELTIVALQLATTLLLNFTVDIWASSSEASANRARASRSKEELEQLRRLKEVGPEGARKAPGEPVPPASEPVGAPKPQATTEVTISMVKPEPSGPGAAYGRGLGERLKAAGKVTQSALKPIVEDLNSQTGMSAADKADAARAAVNVSRPTFGAGPVVEMEGNYVVTSREAMANAPVIVVKPDGVVTFGRVDIVQNLDNYTWKLSNLRIK